MKISVLCNGKTNPIGVDFNDLYFSVQTEGIDVQFVEYEFYRENQVKSGKFFQKEKSSTGICHVNFDGFARGERLYYRAIVNTQKERYFSEVDFAEQGLVETKIVGQWIDNKDFDGRVSEFQKKFVLNEKPISARLYIVGLGFYASAVNGTPTDEDYFKPILTDFDERRNLSNNLHYDEENFAGSRKTVCYDTYDVTELLKEGENELNVLLGTGWYSETDKDHVDASFAFGTPKLFFELHVQGETEKRVFKSDASCKVRSTAITSKMFSGDFVDFTKEAEEWKIARRCAAPSGKLVPTSTAHDTVWERLQPIDCKKTGNTYLYDFGKNHTGGLKLSVKGKRGEKLSIKYYEVLFPDGTPNPHTCRWIAYLNGKEPIGYYDQQGEYILSGGVDEIAPLFRWNCYRYAVIELPEGAEILDLQSLFITSNMKEDGEFSCENVLLTRLYEAFILTQRDNMHCGVPSDCPHREKLPYTGDGQLVAEAAMYAFEAESFYRKWVRDIIDAQGKNGWVPYTAPYISGGGGYWWCNALTSTPLTVYDMTGDKTVLSEALKGMVKLVDCYTSMHDGDYIIRRSCASWLLGDWLAPDVIASDIAYINTLAYYSAALQTRRTAKILSDRETVAKMDGVLEKVKESINKNFFDAENLRYGNGRQGEDLLPFVFGIVPEEYEDALWKKVVAHYKETGCIDTGIVLTPVLLELLTARGEIDVVYEIMNRHEYPSFHYMLAGETTLCEHWSKYWPKIKSAEDKEEVLEGDVSHCHPMYGSVVAWMYKHVAGLDLSELSNGKIIYAPKFMSRIQRASAAKPTSRGRAAIGYDLYGGLKMKITVPYGLEGEVRLPLTECEEFFVKREDGTQLKSRKGKNCVYAKLTGGEWIVAISGTAGN